MVIVNALTAPEEFPAGEEAGNGDHQKGEDQASYNAPERRADAYCVKPGGDSAQCQDRTCEEAGDGICEHRILTASAQATSLYLPFEFQCKDKCSGKGCHACGSKHIRKVAIVFCDTSVDRVEEDADKHESETEISQPAHDVASLPCKYDKYSTKYGGDHKVSYEMSCKESPELNEHRYEGNDSCCNMVAVYLNGLSGS